MSDKSILTRAQIEDAFNKGIISEQEAREADQQRLKATTEIKRKEELKKKASLPPPKFYYDVKIECLLPATITYRILAETPEKAAEMIKGLNPNSVKHRLIGRKELKLSVYDSGSNMIKFMKNLIGIIR